MDDVDLISIILVETVRANEPSSVHARSSLLQFLEYFHPEILNLSFPLNFRVTTDHITVKESVLRVACVEIS